MITHIQSATPPSKYVWSSCVNMGTVAASRNVLVTSDLNTAANY